MRSRDQPASARVVGIAAAGRSSVRRLVRAAAAARGSGPGTPTASLPGGTSFVTTAPAPVFASSPTVTGARSIVSTPRKTRSPIVVRCFRRPS